MHLMHMEKNVSFFAHSVHIAVSQNSCIRNRKYMIYLNKQPLGKVEVIFWKWERREITNGSEMFSL